MRHATLLELAARDGIALPDSLVSEWPPELSAADEKGWFRFQRLYDVARSVLRTPDDVRRLVREAAEDDVRDGGRWLEIQVDPSGYAARFGGITEFTDLVLDCVREASQQTGLGIAVVIAANRTRHPLDARTLARLAVQYVDHGVVGFGLSNDERRGSTADFAPAFKIAERAGLALVPHGGELVRPESSGPAGLAARRPARPRRPVVETRARWTGSSRRACPWVCPSPRGPRRRLRPHVGAPAAAARGRRHRGPRRRRPAAVRLAARRPVRHHAGRPRAHRRTSPSSPRTSMRQPSALGAWSPTPPDIDSWLAAPPRVTPPLVHRWLRYSSTPTRTGSLTRVMPNFAWTPSRSSRARASRSVVVAPPRLVSARACLVERRAGPSPYPLPKPACSISQAALVLTEPSGCGQAGAPSGTSPGRAPGW